MSWFLLQGMLDNPNSPVHDWRFWAWCGFCFATALIVMYFVDKDKP